MRISHYGKSVMLGDRKIGPGTARNLALTIERQVGETKGAGPVIVSLGSRRLRIRDKAHARAMVAALRRAASRAEASGGSTATAWSPDSFEAFFEQLFGGKR